ncbi:MAG: thiamine pyrophosphate-dependent enzyme, partial [Varibaculum cambriense]
EALGAQVANPGAQVWAIDGDGCFQMTNQELAVATLENLPIKVAIINNSVLGMVHQWQELFFDSRFSGTLLQDGEGGKDIPDFVKLAEAYGALGLRARTKEEVDQVITQAMETNDRPVVIDFRVSTDSQVWPMVPAGESNSNVIYAGGQGPVWENEE